MSANNDLNIVKLLLSVSSGTYCTPVSSSIADNSSETASGWKLARGRPEYCTIKTTRRKKQYYNAEARYKLHGSSSVSLDTLRGMCIGGGTLTEDLDYVYNEGLSSRVRRSESPAVTQPHPPIRVLNPVLDLRSDPLTEDIRKDLSRLVQMQLRSDLTSEQLLIEQKLRSMDLSSIPSLSVTGLNAKSRTDLDHFQHKGINQVNPFDPQFMMPYPVHPNNMHMKSTAMKAGRRKQRLKPLKWCSLTTADGQFPPFSKQPESSTVYKTSFSRLLESSVFGSQHRK